MDGDVWERLLVNCHRIESRYELRGGTVTIKSISGKVHSEDKDSKGDIPDKSEIFQLNQLNA